MPAVRHRPRQNKDALSRLTLCNPGPAARPSRSRACLLFSCGLSVLSGFFERAHINFKKGDHR